MHRGKRRLTLVPHHHHNEGMHSSQLQLPSDMVAVRNPTLSQTTTRVGQSGGHLPDGPRSRLLLVVNSNVASRFSFGVSVGNGQRLTIF
jgi:hypothetical protein